MLNMQCVVHRYRLNKDEEARKKAEKKAMFCVVSVNEVNSLEEESEKYDAQE